MAFLKKLFDKNESRPEDKTVQGTIQRGSVYAPVSGTVISLSEVGDGVFSEGILGQGCAIVPEQGTVYVPFDGTVTTVPESKHALGIRSEDGIELLIHVGLDTAEMKGKGFQVLKSEGEAVKAGQAVMTFDKTAVAEAGHPDTVIVVVTNSDDFSEIKLERNGKTESLDKLLSVI